ncbi:EAL domain-containing protein [Clostridium tyrobutyricum]|uniref:EAL domain-containing protein n=1 Tax=Clostridium tyrobutyricum TaxID=1519 RepID=UPI001C39119F|nr:EAL domain-containing protein [Clostridium tyrobutyricum]MBV4432571.1 EAL domain-containing protein [Clostridium tyrobutyricum]
MESNFSKVIDSYEVKTLLHSFYSLMGIKCLIKYREKTFYKHPEFRPLTDFGFKKYDENIVKQIKENRKYGIFKSKTGLMYFGVPIYIDNNTVAIMFTSPILYQKLNLKYLSGEISDFKAHQNDIVDVVKHIPCFSKEVIAKIIEYFCNISYIINKNIRTYSKYSELLESKKRLESNYNTMVKMAYYDELTGLGNCNYLKTEMKKSIESYPERSFILFHVELSNFKNVNDILGYKYGDRLLQKIGNTIRKLYINDIVSRNYGNEFLILKKLENHKINLHTEAKYLLHSLCDVWDLDDIEVPISVSIGMTVYPKDGKDATVMMRNADIALNKAKSNGKNSYIMFENYMYDEILIKSEMEKELRKAIKNEEFELYYQPQVEVCNNKVVGFEALIRWNSSKLGWVMPGEFISLAEETGIITSIGEWVFEKACFQIMQWKNKGYDYDFISINVSPVQIRKNGFVDMIKRVIKKTGVDTNLIELEITESVVMESLERSCGVIDELKRMGIRIALDDFGSGYSSLNYLKSLPINTIKIDKTFIDGICKYSYENIIVDSIINLAHIMKLDVVAEGVESEEQFISLREKRCNKIQGYYFGKPMPCKEAEKMLEFTSLR